MKLTIDDKTETPDIVDRLKEAMVGYPYAKIPWPHRMLHEAADEIERLRQFSEYVIRESCWRGCDADGGAVQDKAEELGLLRKEPYSQERHGESEFHFEPGDDIFVFAWKI